MNTFITLTDLNGVKIRVNTAHILKYCNRLEGGTELLYTVDCEGESRNINPWRNFQETPEEIDFLIVQSANPKVKLPKVYVKLDGGEWLVHGENFVNLQESETVYGPTPDMAIVNFLVKMGLEVKGL